MCVDAQLCYFADVTGDRIADAISVVWEAGVSRMMVGRSRRSYFEGPVVWHDHMCLPGSACVFGDVNHDGRDDAVMFTRNAVTGPLVDDMIVTLSTGSSFGPPVRWHDQRCANVDACFLADVTGDHGDDVIVVQRHLKPVTGDGDVWVTLA